MLCSYETLDGIRYVQQYKSGIDNSIIRVGGDFSDEVLPEQLNGTHRMLEKCKKSSLNFDP